MKPDGRPELTEEKKHALEEIPTMSWDLEPDSYWNRMYDESVKYYDTYGKFKTTKDSEKLDKKICQWFRFNVTRKDKDGFPAERRNKIVALLDRIKKDDELVLQKEVPQEQ